MSNRCLFCYVDETVLTDEIKRHVAENDRLRAELAAGREAWFQTQELLSAEKAIRHEEVGRLGSAVSRLQTELGDARYLLAAERQRSAQLQAALEKSQAQGYCKICGNTLDGYEPPAIRKGEP